MELGLGSDHYKQVFHLQECPKDIQKSCRRHTRGLFVMMRMLYTLIVVVVTRVYTCVKTDQTAQLKWPILFYINFTSKIDLKIIQYEK